DDVEADGQPELAAVHRDGGGVGAMSVLALEQIDEAGSERRIELAVRDVFAERHRVMLRMRGYGTLGLPQERGVQEFTVLGRGCVDQERGIELTSGFGKGAGGGLIGERVAVHATFGPDDNVDVLVLKRLRGGQLGIQYL